MASHTPFGSDSFAIVAKGLVAIHAMIRAGTDESPEAESIRDSLDAPHKVLTPDREVSGTVAFGGLVLDQ